MQIARAVASSYGRHRGSQHAAAISYRVVFSLVPFVALVVSVLDVVLPHDHREQFLGWLFGAFPGAELEASVDRALVRSGASAPLIGLVSLAVLLWGATGMMTSLRLAFGVVWAAERRATYVRGKARDVLLVAFAGALLVAAFALSVVAQVAVETGTDAADALGWTGAGGALAALAEVAGSWVAVAAALLVVYRFVPPVPVSLAAAWPGAVVGAVAFQLAVAGFALYAAHVADFSSAYGPLGAVFAFLLLVYVLAIVVLVGAELVVARAARGGKAQPAPLV